MSLSRFFRRERWDAERAKELESYLQIETDRNIEAGMSPEDARAAARRKLGNLTAIRETIYQMNSLALLDNLWRDLRFAFRALRKRPGFTLIVVLSLALGIGANTAIFSVVDAILLRPLPVHDPGGIVDIDTAASRLTRFGNSSYLDYVDYRNRAKSFKSMAIYQRMSAGMSRAGMDSKPQIVHGLLVSGNYFSTFEVQPILGRAFLPEEGDVPNKYPVAVISYALWNRAFGADPNTVGQAIRLSGHSFTIVGVAPKSFTGTDLFFQPGIFVPAAMSAQVMSDGSDILTQRTYRGFEVRGRLNPGVSVAQAQSEMNVIMSDLEREHPDSNKDAVAVVRKDLSRRMEGQLTLPAILMGLVILVFLMACANVASLLMAKATSRLREIATQISLGATRGNLLRQFLTESAVLAAIGGAVGVLVAYGCIKGVTALVPSFAGSEEHLEFRLDLRVLTYAVAASTAAVFLFGLAPALTAVKEAWSTTLGTRCAASARAGTSR